MQNLRWQGVFTKKWLVIGLVVVNEGVNKNSFFLPEMGQKTHLGHICRIHLKAHPKRK